MTSHRGCSRWHSLPSMVLTWKFNNILCPEHLCICSGNEIQSIAQVLFKCPWRAKLISHLITNCLDPSQQANVCFLLNNQDFKVSRKMGTFFATAMTWAYCTVCYTNYDSCCDTILMLKIKS